MGRKRRYWRTPPPPACRGEANSNAKLVEADVIEIRRLYATGNYTQPQIAARYGVHFTLIGFVVNRKIWRHVG